jgi:hypothetical protein
MHNYAHGLGGKHIWPEIQHHVEELGRNASKMVDTQLVLQLIFLHFYTLNNMAKNGSSPTMAKPQSF